MRHNLSEITAVLKDRRTIYPEFYSDRKIHEEQIEQILNNAIWAPTHGMTQPWRFQVFTGEGRKKLGNFLCETYQSHAREINVLKYDKLKNRPLMAGAVIAVSMARDPQGKILEIEEIEAVACAIQNMHLTCTAWGLGAFWSTPKFIYEPVMNEFLGLEAADKCLGLFYIGYVKEDYEWPKGQRKPIEYNTKWVRE
ncbi:nitroreductase [Putridiphycobacter roseus]|uniref:Putative NAD(P)H nitroreductase n=1 Tax=Putridiphycobacter roseus TaxID=2219161 RepID=A0A2W1N0R9_9FLAO|nr:nitroreductase [Putridiphycobacter roseus]PZE17847.1 nitroreductase [Putridiphycobacter roseus]